MPELFVIGLDMCGGTRSGDFSVISWHETLLYFFFSNFLCRKVHRIQHVLIQSVPREGLGNGHLSFCSSIINPTFARLSLPHVEPSLLSCTVACLFYFKLVLGLFWKNIHVHYKQQNNSNPKSSEQRTSNQCVLLDQKHNVCTCPLDE